MKTTITLAMLVALTAVHASHGPASACEKSAKSAQAKTQMTRIAEAGTTKSDAHSHGDHSQDGHASHHAGRPATLSVEKAWTRATPPGASVAGGFVTITNAGKEPDRLIGGSFALSKRVEVHEMSMADGVMRMAEVAGGLEIAPGATVELQPGGYHLMLMELSDGPKAGETIKGTLRFEKAGEIPVEFVVTPLGAKSLDGAPATGHEGHGGHDMHHNK